MFTWIPIIGPIIEGIVSIFNKKMDTDVKKLDITRTSDLEEAKVSSQIIHDTDSIGLRFLRDLYCTPAVIHLWFTGWDTMIAESDKVDHSWMWHVAKWPDSYAWYPYTVAVFLLGNIGLNIWRRK